jgi:hypothetical protein
LPARRTDAVVVAKRRRKEKGEAKTAKQAKTRKGERERKRAEELTCPYFPAGYGRIERFGVEDLEVVFLPQRLLFSPLYPSFFLSFSLLSFQTCSCAIEFRYKKKKSRLHPNLVMPVGRRIAMKPRGIDRSRLLIELSSLASVFAHSICMNGFASDPYTFLPVAG